MLWFGTMNDKFHGGLYTRDPVIPPLAQISRISRIKGDSQSSILHLRRCYMTDRLLTCTFAKKAKMKLPAEVAVSGIKTLSAALNEKAFPIHCCKGTIVAAKQWLLKTSQSQVLLLRYLVRGKTSEWKFVVYKNLLLKTIVKVFRTWFKSTFDHTSFGQKKAFCAIKKLFCDTFQQRDWTSKLRRIYST